MKKIIAIAIIAATGFATIGSASAGYYGDASIYAPTNAIGQSGAFANK